MSAQYEKLRWLEEIGHNKFDCSLDIAVHPAKSNTIFLTIPGIDGSVDGYEDKYIRIAESVQAKHGAAVVRMANPFISSLIWESNVRQVLDYIDKRSKQISGTDDYELRIMAHSLGAATIASIAFQYPRISRLLLINPAVGLGPMLLQAGLKKFAGESVTILVGSEDHASDGIDEIVSAANSPVVQVEIANGADHHFSGAAFSTFIETAEKYLFD